MESKFYKIGTCALDVKEPVSDSLLTITVAEELLFTPHGLEIPVLWDALDKWARNRPDSEMLNGVWEARERGSKWGNICSNRDVHGKDKQSAPFWFSSGPVTVFLTQSRVGDIYSDLKKIFEEAGFLPKDFAMPNNTQYLETNRNTYPNQLTAT